MNLNTEKRLSGITSDLELKKKGSGEGEIRMGKFDSQIFDIWCPWLPCVLSSMDLSLDTFLHDVELSFHLLSVTISYKCSFRQK